MLFVIRAWRITAVDNRRAKKLRVYSASTGQMGELVVTHGANRIRRGMKYPILQEGMLGSSSRADIRIRCSGVRKRHAHFRLRPDGLLLTSIDGSPLQFDDGNSGRKLLATDGDTLRFGELRLLVVLFDGQTEQVHDRVTAPKQPERYDEYDYQDVPAFDNAIPDDPFMMNQEAPWQDNVPKLKNTKRR